MRCFIFKSSLPFQQDTEVTTWLSGCCWTYTAQLTGAADWSDRQPAELKQAATAAAPTEIYGWLIRKWENFKIFNSLMYHLSIFLPPDLLYIVFCERGFFFSRDHCIKHALQNWILLAYKKGLGKKFTRFQSACIKEDTKYIGNT